MIADKQTEAAWRNRVLRSFVEVRPFEHIPLASAHRFVPAMSSVRELEAEEEALCEVLEAAEELLRRVTHRLPNCTTDSTRAGAGPRRCCRRR